MKKHINILFFSFFFSLNVTAQQTFNEKIDSLSTLINKEVQKSNYQQAVNYAEEALILIEKEQGTTSKAYLVTQNKVNFLYVMSGNLTKAYEGCIKNYRQIQKHLGKNNPVYEEAITIYSNCCHSINDFEALDSLMKIRATFFDKNQNSEEYAIFLLDYGEYYRQQGKYAQAEPLYNKGINLYYKVRKENPNTGLMLSNIGLLYYEMKQYEISLQYYLQAESIYKKTGVPSNHIYYTNLKNNIANLYKNTANYKAAEQLLLNNLKQANKNSIEYALALYSLGNFYCKIKNYKNASHYLALSGSYAVIKIGYQSTIFHASLHGLASIYLDQKKYKKAKKKYKQLINYLDSYNRTKTLSYVTTLHNYALCYYQQNKYDKAIEVFRQEIENLTYLINENLPYASEKNKSEYITQMETNFETFQNFAFDYYTQNPQVAIDLYNQSLNYKNIVLFNSLAQRQVIEKSNNPTLQKTYNQLLGLKQQIAHLYTLPTSKQYTDITVYEKKADSLNNELIWQLNEVSPNQKDLFKPVVSNDNFKIQQQKLNNNEAIVQFIHFERYENAQWSDSFYYCALIIDKNSETPKLIKICTENELKKVLRKTKKQTDINHVGKLYKFTVGTDTQNDSVYQTIWQPLEKHLQNIQTIYLSPVGLLHTVAFDVISYNDTARLCDFYDINYVFSAEKNMPAKRITLSDIETVALWGGIKYNSAPITDSSNIGYLMENNLSLRNYDISIKYLPQTLNEINYIDSLLQTKNKKIIKYTGQKADENGFKKLSNTNINLLHIATHGFYKPFKDFSSRDFLKDLLDVSINPNPLFRSGLLFAGAEQTLNNEKETIKYGNDGIVSAYEVALMWLPETRLVVLSACQTALGDIDNNQDVIGLNRAFKIAGVDYQLVSLWEVPSKQTMELMNLFYSNLAAGMYANEALKKAQNKMREKYISPYFYAAFKLIY